MESVPVPPVQGVIEVATDEGVIATQAVDQIRRGAGAAVDEIGTARASDRCHELLPKFRLMKWMRATAPKQFQGWNLQVRPWGKSNEVWDGTATRRGNPQDQALCLP